MDTMKPAPSHEYIARVLAAVMAHAADERLGHPAR